MPDDSHTLSLVRDAERAEAALADEWHEPPTAARPPKVRRARRLAAPAPPAAPLPAVIAAPVAPGMLPTRETQLGYILAGSVDAGGGAHGGRFTVVSRASGTRFTYRVKPPPGTGKAGAPCRKCEGVGFWRGNRRYPCFGCNGTGVSGGQSGEPERLFVSVLTGPDNTSDFVYLGQILRTPHNRWEHGRKSRIGPDAPSAKAAQWYLSRLFGTGDLADVEVWHDGTCGRCGRDLTDPLSVTRGIGPECWEKMHGG
jgi:hypothetical protein